MRIRINGLIIFRYVVIDTHNNSQISLTLCIIIVVYTKTKGCDERNYVVKPSRVYVRYVMLYTSVFPC